ncbi:MAG: TIGR02710 family CRISPR-associated CARF protein [Nitrospirales bacterium]|nr:TIGR02710 family CRISPR-associated protein [Nitrospira sp. NTP2]MCK6499890.1 TIGR02710 family CRISPR-associated CARF protein [Nitrospira sp.]MEB2339300.1 TIGR02710 family CRISPR-associated CARF protein [Nitrospirales bacterium]QOJ35522.1 MAG: TIGR02710 family CRISPR-associated protein [Nitrospira sp.]RIK61320.1 MAG: TIGR02710 family CRISPR-associated protein [Nitrospira sp.]
MAPDSPVKALVLAFTDASAPAAYVINRLQPELLCFFVPESAKAQVEAAVQPLVRQMPKRWDWVVTPDPSDVIACHQALSRSLHDLFQTWDVRMGEVVVDLTGATAAMAAALASASQPWTSRVISLVDAQGTEESEPIVIDGIGKRWVQGNPWDDAAVVVRREACEAFNHGSFKSAAILFHTLEARVSGGQKPLYRALGDLALGYGLWEQFHYRQAWEKLKTSFKALDMASLWGGPPGLKALLPAIKANSGFLEKLVLDPAEVKDGVVLDLLAHAHRRAQVDHDPERAMATLVRALEAVAQRQLFKQHKIKTWDVQPDQLPADLRDTCRTCCLDDVDGKYKLPWQGQFRVLAGLGDQTGQAFLREWPKMKPLIDAANHAVLGHGFEAIKAERVQQLAEIVMKLSGVTDNALPKFPVLAL